MKPTHTQPRRFHHDYKCDNKTQVKTRGTDRALTLGPEVTLWVSAEVIFFFSVTSQVCQRHPHKDPAAILSAKKALMNHFKLEKSVHM